MSNMSFSEMFVAIQNAEDFIKRAEMFKERMARFLIGRLRGINRDILSRLKKELKDFNSVTGEWK